MTEKNQRDFDVLLERFRTLGRECVLVTPDGTRLVLEDPDGSLVEFAFDASGKLISWQVR